LLATAARFFFLFQSSFISGNLFLAAFGTITATAAAIATGGKILLTLLSDI